MAKISVKGAARAAAAEEARVVKETTRAVAIRPVKSNGGRLVNGTPGKTIDSFVNMMHGLGIGADNPLSTASYGFNPITRNRIQLEWMHRGSWLAGLAVDIPADDMTRKGVEFTNEMDPSISERINMQVTGLQVWHQINEVIRWARLYGGAIGVVLIDGQDPRTPLRPDLVGPGQFKGIACLDRWMLEPTLDDLVTDLGPHLGLPRYYRVGANAPVLRGASIHYSRVAFRMVGIPLPYNQALTEQLWGISVLERIFDRMSGFDGATTGVMQLVYKSYQRTLSVEGLRDVVANGGDAYKGFLAYVNNMRRMQGIEGLSVIDAKDKLEAQTHQAFSGLADTMVHLGQQLSGALQIPLVRLFGQSPAGLNSTGESDLRTYYDHISNQQQKHLTRGVLLTYVLAARSLGIQLPENFMVKFASLLELNDEEKAGVASEVASAVATAFDDGLITQKAAMQELRQSSSRTGIFSNITHDMINEADDQVNPPPGADEVLAGLSAQFGNGNPEDPNANPSGAGAPAANGPGAVPPRPIQRVAVRQ